jgi:hypothetical protein
MSKSSSFVRGVLLTVPGSPICSNPLQLGAAHVELPIGGAAEAPKLVLEIPQLREIAVALGERLRIGRCPEVAMPMLKPWPGELTIVPVNRAMNHWKNDKAEDCGPIGAAIPDDECVVQAAQA